MNRPYRNILSYKSRKNTVIFVLDNGIKLWPPKLIRCAFEFINLSLHRDIVHGN